MLLRISERGQLKNHGWTTYPEYVTASHNLWRLWKQQYESSRKSVMIRDRQNEFRPSFNVDINGMRFSIINNVVHKAYIPDNRASPPVPGQGAKIINGLMFYYENNTLVKIERRNEGINSRATYTDTRFAKGSHTST